MTVVLTGFLTRFLTRVHTKVPIGVLLIAVALAMTTVVAGQGNLVPTAHPPVPPRLPAMWMAPQGGSALSPVLTGFVRGVRLLEEENNAAAALPLVSASGLVSTPLADYARYYEGLALLSLKRYAAADRVFDALAAKTIEGHLPEDASLKQAEGREAAEDFAGAVKVYEGLVTRKLARPHVAWLGLGLAAERAGQASRSVEALQRVYFDYPTSGEADRAAAALDKQKVKLTAALVAKEIARADALFASRRWSHAGASYERALPFLDGDTRARAEVRIAGCDVSLGRHRQGREALEAHLDGPVAAEANYQTINAVRGLKLKDTHRTLARAFVNRFPTSPFADDVLDNLATAYIIDDDDEQADLVFREILDRYPDGRFAERAAWKSGWWAYRDGRFAEAVRVFDAGAARSPRSDYRPSWLYWSGRAAVQIGQTATGTARLRLAATDYHNSYYGRLALKRLAGLRAASVAPTLRREPAPPDEPAVPTADRVALLLATGLNREAMGELQYAQRMWGDSPRLQATIALTHRRLGNVRAGINAMKRAYPQYLAAGGETMPSEILQVIFPVDYWDLLRKYSASRGLDPYLVAALVVQESNFDPIIRSHANAIGLMQILPSTARAYGRKLGIRNYSERRLTDAEVNVIIGTQIFADTIKKFGGVHFALAAYNAGDSRVAAWRRERPGMPQDEFIDDIPFPETQNYVKRILGTADDYRHVYGPKT